MKNDALLPIVCLEVADVLRVFTIDLEFMLATYRYKWKVLPTMQFIIMERSESYLILSCILLSLEQSSTLHQSVDESYGFSNANCSYLDFDFLTFESKSIEM